MDYWPFIDFRPVLLIVCTFLGLLSQLPVLILNWWSFFLGRDAISKEGKEGEGVKDKYSQRNQQ